MKQLEARIKQYLEERNWDKLRPSDLAKSISIEAAELLELFQWSSQTIEETQQDAEKMEEIKKELGDIFIYAINMSISLGFDTKQIILDKLALVEKKYPAEVVKDKKPEEIGTQKMYMKIKKQYRDNA